MKRCPECRRDYYDDTLLYCLDDGSALVQGSVPSPDGTATAQFSEPGAVATGFPVEEPQTAILHSTAAPSEAPTRAQISTTGKTAILARGTEAEPQESVGGLSEKYWLWHKKRASVAEAGNRSANRAAKPLFAAVVAVALLVGGFAGYRYLTSTPAAQINSIAVLPFENRSGDADTDYLSDGLADSLIYRLSQLPNLKVSPTSSVMRYKGKETDVAQIAKDLEVDAVMSGRLMQRGDDLSISVQLIDSRTRKLLWAEQYDRKMSDFMATQREIATTITQKLQLKLAGDEIGISKKYTDSNEAYQLYLKARYHYAKRTKGDFNKAIEYFEQAIELDPSFALAFAMLSDLYTSMPAYPYMSPKDALPKATLAARRALEVDPSLPEAHSAMGYSLCFSDRNFPEAERHFKRALELDPRSSLTHLRYGIYFKVIGRVDAAVKETQKAVELEPLNLVNSANLTWTYMDAGQLKEAIANGQKLNDLEPGFGLGGYQLGLAYSANGMHADAIALAESTLQHDPQNQKMLQVAGYAYARSGKAEDARSVIARLKEMRKTQYVISYFIATIFASLGDRDAAFAELEKAADEQDWRMTAHIKRDFMLEPLRGNPTYKNLVKRLNLPE
jgi:TolB-like protein/Flp pilus assembly protein TadD